jgi:hypothetical protein
MSAQQLQQQQHQETFSTNNFNVQPTTENVPAERNEAASYDSLRQRNRERAKV